MVVIGINNKEKFHISAVELTLIYNVRYSHACNISDLINHAMDEFKISDTAARRNMFLAQLSHESRFNARAEDLNYSAGQLQKVWPKRFPTLESTSAYAGNPEKLGNFVYGDRMQNAGEGFRYRGRGGIQITGKNNYRRLSRDLKMGTALLDNPDLMLSDELAWRGAAWFWHKKGLNEITDRSPDDISRITKIINGGQNGIEDRMKQYRRIMEYMPDNGGALLQDVFTSAGYRIS